MNNDIKSLTPIGKKSPPLWTMFMDGTNPPAYSYSRIIGFIVISIFMIMMVYFSFISGTLIVPPKEWIYIIVAFSLMKPIQRFAETKDNENQLNYDFQMAQLAIGKEATPLNSEKKVDNSNVVQ